MHIKKYEPTPFHLFLSRITTNVLVWGLDQQGLECIDALLENGSNPDVIMGFDKDPKKVKVAYAKHTKFASAHFFSDSLDHAEFNQRFWEDYNPMYFCRFAFVTLDVSLRCAAILELIEKRDVQCIACPAPVGANSAEEKKIYRAVKKHNATLCTWDDSPKSLIAAMAIQ